NTVQLLRDHIQENRLGGPEQFDKPLFQNARNQRLSCSGIRYILKKISRPSTGQASESEPNSESTLAEAHQGNAPVAERNLARYDPRLPRPRRCQNNSDLRERQSGDEAKRA